MGRGIRRVLVLALSAGAAIAVSFGPVGSSADAGPQSPGAVPQSAGVVPIAGVAAKCRHAKERPADLTVNQLEEAVECLVNKRRKQRGRSSLKEKSALSLAAARHSLRMLASGCFDHICAGEPDLTGRLHATSYLPCKCTWRAGENLAWGRAKLGTPTAIVKAWMKSKKHRSNILTGDFEHLGVGAARGRPGNATQKSSATYTFVFGFRN